MVDGATYYQAKLEMQFVSEFEDELYQTFCSISHHTWPLSKGGKVSSSTPGVSGWMVRPPDVPDGQNSLGNMNRPAFTFINLYIFIIYNVLSIKIFISAMYVYIF